MIKQRLTTTKTATDTLTVSEMGDILCSSASAQTYTLPTASKGLWYRLTNINTGEVTVGGLTLAQGESCLCTNDGTTWYYSKGSDDLTGAEIKVLYEGEDDTNAYTDSDETKVGLISVTQAVDLDDMESDISDLQDEFSSPTYSSIATTDGSITQFPTGTEQSRVLTQIKGITWYNNVVNGNMASTSGWINATSAIGNILLVDNYRTYRTDLPAKNDDVYFLYAKVRETSGTGTSIGIGYTGALEGKIINPVQNQWYEVYSKNSISTTSFVLQIYCTNSTQIEIDGNAGVYAINMTALRIESKTEEEMYYLVTNGYFDEIQNAIVNIKTEGKNLFNKLQYTAVDYAYKITINPSTQYTWSESIAYKLYDLEDNEVSSGTASTVTGGATAYQIAFANTIADTDAFMLVEDSATGSYVPYLSNDFNPQIELKSVGSNQDILYNAIVDLDDSTKYIDIQKWIHDKSTEEVTVVGVVAVNTTNYPLALNGGNFINVLTAGGSETGVIGTDSTSASGTMVYDLATPVVTELDLGELYSYPSGRMIQNEIPCDIDYSVTVNQAAVIESLTSTVAKLEEKTRHIEAGTAIGSASVTFDTSYAQAPAIFPSDVTSITTTGFTMNASGGDWIAIEK